MKICWVTNEVWYSRLLRWLFNEETSHVGSIFSFDGVDLAVDVNRPCGTLWSKKYWLHKYSIVWQVDLQLTKEKELELFKACEEYAVLRVYDMKGYYYGMIWGLLHKLFRIPLPKYNKWSSHTGSMCQEILVPILQSHIVQESGVHSSVFDFSNMTPDMTMEYMKTITKANPLWSWTYNG